MHKGWILGLTACIAANGCTTFALRQYTLNQNRTSGDFRDAAVLECLADVAADPAILPSFSLLTWGATTVTDSFTLAHTVTPAPFLYTKEAFAGTVFREPKGQWTVDPAAEYERLEALHAACLWVLFGPDRAHSRYPEILGSQYEYLNTNPHFDVEKQLAQIPPGWLHVGKLKDVPPCARYKGHKGETWVWVMPNDAESFAQFTLVLLDIATLELTYSVNSTPIVVVLTTISPTKIPDVADRTKAVVITTSEQRYVKKEYKEVIEKEIQKSMETGNPVALTRAQWLAYTNPWFGARSVPAGTPAPSLPTRPSTSVQLPTVTAIPGRAAPKAPAIPIQ